MNKTLKKIMSIFLNIYYNKIQITKYIYTILGSILMLINSIYYCNKTVGNYHVRLVQYNKNDKYEKDKKLLSLSDKGIL